MDGLINLDKSPGITSARAVAAVKYLTPRGTKVGHAGTLDPFATGVLLILVGKGTKLCVSLMGLPKRYVTTIKLGAMTETLDPDSPEQIVEGACAVELSQIQQAISPLVGCVQQLPPAYSALKIAGQPAYKLARRGEQVELKPRTVQIYSIEILRYAWPFLELNIHCGRGTYIRSIARDLGQSLNTGAYLTQLRRTAIGPFDVNQAVTVDRLREAGIDSALLPPDIKQGRPVDGSSPGLP